MGCRIKGGKEGFARIVRRPDGTVSVDPSGRVPGRGAYLHPDPACLRLAFRRGAVARALRVPLPPAETARLMEELRGMAGDEA